ncbi:MAG: GNAT family N-acetyltransferase, partial [Fibrobacterota bacterium]
GSALVEHSLKMADNMGYKAVIILGNPDNYCKFGFKNGKDLGVSDPDGKYPYGLLVLELEKGIFGKNKWKYEISPAYNLDPEKTEEFDKGFEEKKKEFRYTQEQFSMAVRAFLD